MLLLHWTFCTIILADLFIIMLSNIHLYAEIDVGNGQKSIPHMIAHPAGLLIIQASQFFIS